MIMKWIKSVVTTPSGGEASPLAQGAQQRKKKETGLIDVAHEAMRRDAKDLEGLVTVGQPTLDRRKLKEKIKRRVKGSIAKEFDADDIVEEVTERILDAAEFDPNYRDIFEEK
jgi:hypothetical protein